MYYDACTYMLMYACTICMSGYVHKHTYVYNSTCTRMYVYMYVCVSMYTCTFTVTVTDNLFNTSCRKAPALPPSCPEDYADPF
jgi:hypothetical protein